ncbi:MAG: YeaH/YhbH family protein [Chromatiaceae bacterium]|nr:YeaH/YhbH family protein [Chromatiaceae bacterium]
MSHFIDRRLNGKHKSAVNRQRFIRRYKDQLKRSVAEAVNQRSITNVDSGERVGIPARDIAEPVFQHGPGGTRELVHPGNTDFLAGDRLRRPEGGGQGSGQGRAGKGGRGEDDFVFELSREEFMDLLFEDLALPNLVRNQLMGATEFKTVRAGYSTEGSPSNIDVVRSLKGAIARRTALGASARARIRELEDEIEALLAEGASDEDARIREGREEIDRLRTRLAALPFIDTFDLRYQSFTRLPEPTSKAVMLCIMDVSGSMDQARKNLAKRFFILLYLFLQRNYDQIDLVFIRHHTIAQEVDEEEFFYSRETGGTVVSSALELADEIVRERYDPAIWNVYAAQASDGDNWDSDSVICRDLLIERLLPLMRYYAYIEITPRQHQSLWYAYREVQEASTHFAMQEIAGAEDIYPVFRELFKRQEVS